MSDTDDRKTLRERLVEAFASTDLSISDKRRGDADYLTGLGMAAQRSSRVGGALLRLDLAGSRDDLRDARAAVIAMVKRLSAIKCWRLSNVNAVRVAEQALLHRVSPKCPVCSGRKFYKPEGSPALTNRVCEHCGGTGLRPMLPKYRGEILAVLSRMDEQEKFTERAVMQVMR